MEEMTTTMMNEGMENETSMMETPSANLTYNDVAEPTSNEGGNDFDAAKIIGGAALMVTAVGVGCYAGVKWLKPRLGKAKDALMSKIKKNKGEPSNIDEESNEVNSEEE